MAGYVDTVALVVAAGSGQRMGGVEKAFLPLDGLPLVSYPLRVLEKTPEIDAIVLVLSIESVERGRHLVNELGLRKVTAVSPGGFTRRDSVLAGIDAAPDSLWTLVHDGARPLLTPSLITRGLAAARANGGAVAAVPVQDTIKEVGPSGLIIRTPDRSRLQTIQTPQIFKTKTLRRAHIESPPGPFTDDAALLEAMGWPVSIYLGDPSNLKVTTPSDVILAEALISQQEDGKLGNPRWPGLR